QVYGERDNQFYQVRTNPPNRPDTVAPSRTIFWGNTTAAFFEEQYKLTNWLTVNAGLRLTHYEGPVSENAADPRIGAALRLPHLGWVLRGFYGRYYQPPPLASVTNVPGQSSLPLQGERDEQREFGVAIPWFGWTFDVSNFRTGARNYFDHDALGSSNIFFPLTLAHARIRGWEASAGSPTIAGRARLRLAYSHQFAEWSGQVTSGLITGDICYTLCFLDHDQRDT